MYTKEMLEVLGIVKDSHIVILDSALSSDKTGYDCYVQGIEKDYIRVLSSENKKNNNVATTYWKNIWFYSKFTIREADAKLAARRQKLAADLPKILSYGEDILFGKEDAVRVAVRYTIDDGPPTYLWGTESEINQVLACTHVDKQSIHKLMFTSSPDQKQVRALLQKCELIADQVSLHGISDFAEDFYRGMKYPTVLSHSAARKYLSRLPAGFVAWHVTQSLTDHSDVQLGAVQCELGHGLTSNELSEETGVILFGLNELVKSRDEFKSKYKLLTRLLGRKQYWKSSTTEPGLSVILVARRSSLQEQDLIRQVSQAVPFPVDHYGFQKPSLHALVEAAIEEVSRRDQGTAPQDPGNYPSDKCDGSAASMDSYILPEMTGFNPAVLGEGPCLWTSPCYVLADRDLQPDEQVDIWAVDPINGRLLKTVSLQPTQENLSRNAWPAALVAAVQADTTFIDGSVLLQAGHISPEAELAVCTEPPTSSGFVNFAEGSPERAMVDRLWAFDSHCRVFSNLPFKANQVLALQLPLAAPAIDDRVCIQVRHRTSQWLYESHVFTPLPADRDTWSKPLCDFLNQNSSMLRAGQRQDDGITIRPADTHNALWIPQLSELSVHVESIGWVKHDDFTASSNLTTQVLIAVHDDVTGAPLPGSPFTFTPAADAQASDKWPEALARQLAASELAAYLKFEKLTASGTAATGKWAWWRAGVPVRIWMSRPFSTQDWPGTVGVDDDEVLNQFLVSENAELVIESRDVRTGLLCHQSSMVLPPLNTQMTETEKLAELKRCIAQHMEVNKIFWRAPDDSIAQTNSTTPENNKSHFATMQLDTALTIKSTFPHEHEAVLFETAENLLNVRANTFLKYHLVEQCSVGTIDTSYYSLECSPQMQELLDSLGKKRTDQHQKLSTSSSNLLKLIDYTTQDERIELVELAQWDLTFWHQKHSLPLADFMKEIGLFEKLASQLFSTNWISNEDSVDPPTALMHELIKVDLKAPSACQPVLTPDSRYPERGNTEESNFRSLLQKNLNNKAFIQAHLSPHADVKSSSITIHLNHSSPTPQALVLSLSANTVSQGFSFISCQPDEGSLLLDLHTPFKPKEHFTTAEILIGISSAAYLWKKIQASKAHKYNQTIQASADTLCVDMAVTQGSSLFATTPSQLSGVSPQTGLFHAHLPIAKLSSLSGRGPSIDLALSYSPLRANEGGLGDGWAFTFSYYDNREKVLTLSNGTVDRLADDDLEALCDNNRGSVARNGYLLKNANGSNVTFEDHGHKQFHCELTSLTVEYANGQEEVLGLPQQHDKLESAATYKAALKEKIDKTIEALSEKMQKSTSNIFSADMVLEAFTLPLNFLRVLGNKLINENTRELQRAELNAIKSDLVLYSKQIEHDALILVPLSIVSPLRETRDSKTPAPCETLSLGWKAKNGHVHLETIRDGEACLLTVTSDTDPVLQGSVTTELTLWPNTEEEYTVKLNIEKCLLRTLTSIRPEHRFDKRYHFDYAATPELDFVLSSLAKDDGSLEAVNYSYETDSSLPRVALHTIVPGGQRPHLHHAWRWEGDTAISAAIRYEHAPVGSDLTQVPFTRWEWSYDAGRPQLDRQIDEVPGEQRRTHHHVYQTDSSVPENLRSPQQTEQHVTLEDLRVTPPTEEQQP